jgi:predicted NAD/FAD-binding protein
MLGEIPHFHRQARRVEGSRLADDVTLGAFLEKGGYSPYFVQHFVTPLIAAVWSCGATTALRYPARYLFAFLANHGMLSIGGSPPWRTVVGGSRAYVDRIAAQLTDIRIGTPVRVVHRAPALPASPSTTPSPSIEFPPSAAVTIHDDADRTEDFDGVVIATHPDQALRMLAEPTLDERAVLGAFQYSKNLAVLHTDPSVLPRHRRAQAGWNYRMPSCAGDAEQVQVTYDMTRLHRLGSRERYLVSLNCQDGLSTGRMLAEMGYAHPQYTPQAVAAQRRLPDLNAGVTTFAGAYHGWGFHEDGARSGLTAALALGGSW